MGHTRPRYNAKGRAASLLRDRKGKAKEQEVGGGVASGFIDDAEGGGLMWEEEEKRKEEKERQRKEKIAGEMNAAPKMSKKKQQRLDQYIEKKLKKERRSELIEQLSKTQSISLDLKSSKHLGSQRFLTGQEALKRIGEMEEKRVERRKERGTKGRRRRSKGDGYHTAEEEEEEEEDDYESSEVEQGKKEEPMVQAVSAPSEFSGASVIERPSTAAATERHQKPRPAELKENNRPLSAPVPQQNTFGSGLGAGAQLVVVQGKKRRIGQGLIGRFKRRKLEEDSEDEETNSAGSETEGDGPMELVEDVEGPALGGEVVDEDIREKGGGDADSLGDEESWHGIIDDDDQSDGGDGKENPGGDEESDDEEQGAVDGGEEPGKSRREKGGFEKWALEQAGWGARQGPDNSGVAYAAADASVETPTLPPGVSAPELRAQRKPDGTFYGPLGENVEFPANSLMLSGPNGPSVSSKKSLPPVVRPSSIQDSRLQLPIISEEEPITTTILHHPIVIVCGETGSGKTTQVPQFLYEAGFGREGSGCSGENSVGIVGITQPRRVAAMSMATRVGSELNLPPSKVSYQIRYDSTTSAGTAIKFMTDGVLLRELAGDFLLKRYSVVVVDEAHERSVNTDVLIGVLSRVVRLREEMWREGREGIKPLRLIIMSATLRITDFTLNKTLFPVPPPVIDVPGRTYPVSIHFNRRTSNDYLQEAYKKVSKIHARLPPGGILVFLTGQGEITALCRKLEKRFGRKSVEGRIKERERIFGVKATAVAGGRFGEGKSESGADAEQDLKVEVTEAEVEEIELGDADLAGDVDDGQEPEDPEALDSDEEGDGGGDEIEEDSDVPMHILPLYSLLSTDRQMRVFKDAPRDARTVVVSTNVAETSLTIPGIRYVVDCGRAKERHYDVGNGVQQFRVSWISQASASQRAGRAGRTGPGHCYRLYSSSVFQNFFDEHSKPEILRMPIEGIVLQMKSMNIDAVSNFPFPTPPDRESLRKAEKMLVNLGALTTPPGATEDAAERLGGQITDLGRAMSMFPLAPRYSKMLVAGHQHGCLPFVIAIVSALSVGDPFLREDVIGKDEDGDDDDPQISAKELEGLPPEVQHIRRAEIRAKEERKAQRRAFFRAQQAHSQLGNGASDIFRLLSVVGAYEYDGGSTKFCAENFVRAKAMEEIHKLRAQISAIVQSTYPGIDAAFIPNLQPPSDTQLKMIRQLVTSAYIDQVAVRADLIDSSLAGQKFASTRGVPYRAIGITDDVYIHPSSVLYHSKPPDFVVFQELHRTSQVWIKSVTKINPAWLSTLGKPLCSFTRILETTSNLIHGAPLKKSTDPNIREFYVVPRFGPGIGIELPPVKMTQRRVGSRWVFA